MLLNKVIVISGGTKGIGKALAIECVKQGANVVIGGRDQDAFEEIRSLVDNEKVAFSCGDLHCLKSSNKLLNVAIKKFKRVDGYVNYAGITPVASLSDCEESVYDSVMDINIKSAFFNCQNAIRLMRKTGGGSIILVGSAHSWRGEIDRAPYAISKGALLTLSEHIAYNYAREQIRCNFITMGWTPTEGEVALRKQAGISVDELKQKASKIIPMGRMLTPEDHIPAFIYLLSDKSSMVTGSNIRITGGEYI